MKRFLAALVMAVIIATAFAGTAMAYEEGNSRVAIGADLDEAEREQIYSDFGVEPGSVEEIIVTNSDERVYLEGIAPEGKIGNVALSCVYITILEEGSGISLSTNNINWCTTDMYINALATAGIGDARVMISAPFPVSGTAALTGIYKAYEDITGNVLSEIAKEAGVEELVITGELAEYIGSEEAAQIVTELKKILDQTQTMTDEEVKNEIKGIAAQYKVSISDAQLDQLVSLCRKLEKLDVEELRQKLVGLAETVDNANKVKDTVTKIGETVKSFFSSVTDFFAKLFGRK